MLGVFLVTVYLIFWDRFSVNLAFTVWSLRILLCLSPSAGITGASHVSSGIQIGPHAWMASTSVATTSLVSILWRILIWPGFDIAVICPVVKHFLTSRCWTPSGLNTFYPHMIHLKPSCFSSESKYVLGESAFAHILASYSHVEHCRCGKISEGPSLGTSSLLDHNQMPYTGNAVLFRRPCEPVHYSHFSNSFLSWFSV